MAVPPGAVEGMETPSANTYSRFACNGDIEHCATEEIFGLTGVNQITETPYIMVGVVTIIDLIVTTAYYWARMNTRSKKTGTTFATNWVDVTSLILWISMFVLFTPFFFMYPFHWLNSEKLDWVIGWYIVNLIGDIVPALTAIFFFWYLIVAAGAGGDEEHC